MLKIKDDIDLKELEKFGFKKWHYRENHDYYIYPNTKDYAIYIFIETREIMVDKFYDNHLTVLYDLIKADLVEKVEDRI